MTFSDDTIIRIFMVVLGLLGFATARHIYNHKKEDATPLVCPMQFDCTAVVHSDYSKFLGIPVEVLGMMYYALVSLFYTFFIFKPEVLSLPVVNLLIAMSLIAFLFSIYLIVVQIFILNKGCSWCIVSAIISALIFILAVATYNLSYVVEIFV